MCTSPKGQKPWKKELVKRWENLVLLYKSAKESPTIRRWWKVMCETGKIFLSVLLKKAFERWIRNF